MKNLTVLSNNSFLKQYCEKINSGEITVCEKIKQGFELVLDSLNNPIYRFDIEKAQRPIYFIEKFCKNSKGKWLGKPVELLLWQKAIIEAIFGIVDDFGNRKYKEVLIVVGRKNGKSVLLSALALYMMLADHEGGAEIACVASKKDQAKIVFTEAKNMVEQSRVLSKRVKKRKSDLFFSETFSTFMPLSSDSNTLDGLNLHCGIIDELHSIKDRNIYDVTKQSMTAREQPLLFMITTAGFNRETIYDNMYEYAESILNKKEIDESFIPFIYELDSKAEYLKEECWIKANPSLDVIKTKDYLRSFIEKAKIDTSFLPTLLTKDFNIKDTIAETWLSFDIIENKEEAEFKDMYVIGGCDLSSTTDLTCASLLGFKNNKIFVKQMYWLPEKRLEQRINEDKVPYDIWHRKGLLRVSEGNKVNYSDVTKWFLEEIEINGLRPLWIGYDSWNANYWKDEMISYGFDMVEVRQGAKTMSAPMKQLEADLRDKNIVYNNNPVLKWCLSNTAIKVDDNGNIRPVKNKNQRQRIDGAVSLIDAYCVFCDKKQDYINLEG